MGFVVVNGVVHGNKEGKARHVTNDGVTVVWTSTHLLALVVNQTTLDSEDSPRLGLGGSHHLPPYSIFSASPRHPHSNGFLSHDSQGGVP
jgi:hypothetical protein